MRASQVIFEEGRLPQPVLSGTAEFSFTNAMPRADRRKVDLSDMTFSQLREELQDLERRLETSAPVEKLSTDDLREKLRQLKSQKKLDLTLPARVQMHRQVAFSFACLIRAGT